MSIPDNLMQDIHDDLEEYQGHMTDPQFDELLAKHDVTMDELIQIMVDKGWTHGLNKNCELEYWSPK